MIKGIFASGSSLQPRMLRMEVIANNLANIETAGFKKEHLFVQILKSAGGEPTQTENGDLAGIEARQYIDLTAGNLRPTGNPLDIALEGEGFFLVDTPQGDRLTRNGSFSLSSDGSLITPDGYALLGQNGPIRLPVEQRAGTGTLAISQTGEVLFNEQAIGTLRIVSVEDSHALRKEGSSLMRLTDDGMMQELEPDKVRLRQGYLEESNVDGVTEMIEMVELNRSFESDQKSITYQDGTLQQAMDVGRM